MTQSDKTRSLSSSSNLSSLPQQLTLTAAPSSATGATASSHPEPGVAQPATAVAPVMPPLPFLHSSRRPSFAPPRHVQRTAVRQASPRSIRGGVRGGR